mmetsp:Transcript_36660/g.53704  ORF Transcript_36660/g.53704 Transcript_36660/m.53704 type:complete len:92 (+) Transcript_36660:102-377(+)
MMIKKFSGGARNGPETIQINSLPAVITRDLRLNEPRYATLSNIMKAKKKVDMMETEGLGVDSMPRNKVLDVYEPPKKKKGVMVANVHECLD